MPWRLHIRLPHDAMAMGTNPLLLLDELRALGDLRRGRRSHCGAAARGAWIRRRAILAGTSHWRPRSRGPAIEQVFLFVLDEMQLDLEQIAGTVPAVPERCRSSERAGTAEPPRGPRRTRCPPPFRGPGERA
ncbi:MAG: hypothetical protein WDN25_12980 [Acetobacteraceae bacterium]